MVYFYCNGLIKVIDLDIIINTLNVEINDIEYNSTLIFKDINNEIVLDTINNKKYLYCKTYYINNKIYLSIYNKDIERFLSDKQNYILWFARFMEYNRTKNI